MSGLGVYGWGGGRDRGWMGALDVLLLAGLCATLYRDRLMALEGFEAAVVAAGFVLLVAIAAVNVLARRRRTRRELVEERDERAQLVSLRCRAGAMDAVALALYLLTYGCLMAYGVTGVQGLLWMFAGTVLPLGVWRVAMLVLAFRHDRV